MFCVEAMINTKLRKNRIIHKNHFFYTCVSALFVACRIALSPLRNTPKALKNFSSSWPFGSRLFAADSGWCRWSLSWAQPSWSKNVQNPTGKQQENKGSKDVNNSWSTPKCKESVGFLARSPAAGGSISLDTPLGAGARQLGWDDTLLGSARYHQMQGIPKIGSFRSSQHKWPRYISSQVLYIYIGYYIFIGRIGGWRLEKKGLTNCHGSQSSDPMDLWIAWKRKGNDNGMWRICIHIYIYTIYIYHIYIHHIYIYIPYIYTIHIYSIYIYIYIYTMCIYIYIYLSCIHIYIHICYTISYVYLYIHKYTYSTWKYMIYIYIGYSCIYVYIRLPGTSTKITSTMVIVWGSKWRISSRSVPACTDGIRTVREHKNILEMGFAIPNPSWESHWIPNKKAIPSVLMLIYVSIWVCLKMLG